MSAPLYPMEMEPVFYLGMLMDQSSGKKCLFLCSQLNKINGCAKKIFAPSMTSEVILHFMKNLCLHYVDISIKFRLDFKQNFNLKKGIFE